MSELKAISRAGLLRVIKILNKETDLMKKIGEGKVPVVGKGTKADELQENYKRIMLKLDEEKLIDETPEEAIDFWEENLDHFVEPAPPEEEEEEEKVPVKEKKKREVKTSSTPKSEILAFLSKLISQKKYTRKEMVDLGIAEFPDKSKGAIGTYISDGKNPKYNPFDKLVIDKGGILSYEK